MCRLKNIITYTFTFAGEDDQRQENAVNAADSDFGLFTVMLVLNIFVLVYSRVTYWYLFSWINNALLDRLRYTLPILFRVLKCTQNS